MNIRGKEIDIEFKNGTYYATNNKRRATGYERGDWVYGKPETISDKELLVVGLQVFGRKGKIHLEHEHEDKAIVCDNDIYAGIFCRVDD